MTKIKFYAYEKIFVYKIDCCVRLSFRTFGCVGANSIWYGSFGIC